jgi:hypothetical protein
MSISPCFHVSLSLFHVSMSLSPCFRNSVLDQYAHAARLYMGQDFGGRKSGLCHVVKCLVEE